MVAFWHGDIFGTVTFWHSAAIHFQGYSSDHICLLCLDMQRDQIAMRNWAAGGTIVGWWGHIEEETFLGGLKCYFWPAQNDGQGWVEVVPYHKNPEGYFWLRLSGGGDNRVLWHRQLYQDLQGRPLAENIEVHHVDHDRANNCAANLVARRGRDHRRHHARARRGPAGWRRIRAPRRNQVRQVRRGTNAYIPFPNYVVSPMHTYIHTCMHACMHTYIHTYLQTYILTY